MGKASERQLWRMAKRVALLELARWLLRFGFAIGALKRVEKETS
jgi:hypothetical protein